MLPNINGKQAAQTAPGVNPNNRTKSTGSLLGQYSTSVISQLADNISPTNFIRQGTYGAFGNNALTRAGMGVVDASSDLLDKFLGIKNEDEDTPTDKLLKEQIKLLTKTTEEIDDTNKILKELLEVEKTKIETSTKKSEKDETEIENIKKKKKKVKVEPKDFKNSLLTNDRSIELEGGQKDSLLQTIAKDVVDIKEILTHGFDSVANIFEKSSDTDGKFRKKRKLNDVEDAVIISETKFGGKSQSEKSLIQKYRIETMKTLKRIALGVDKIYEIVSQSSSMTAPEDKDEANRREKHMGMAQEVTDVIPKSEVPRLPDETNGGGVGGAVTAVIALLMTQMKNLRTIIVDMFKSGVEKFKGALESAWEFGKKTVSNIFAFVKEKGSSLIEGAEKLAGNIAEKVAGAGGLKAIAKKGFGALVKATPVVGELVAGGLAAYDAYDASKNAKDILGIEGRDATTGEKIEAGIGGAVESLSFGLISKEKTAKWIDGLMTDKNDKQDKLNQKQEELNQRTKDKVSPPAEAAGAPSVSVNTTNNSYFGNRKMARNDDSSYNRYLDRHYAF